MRMKTKPHPKNAFTLLKYKKPSYHETTPAIVRKPKKNHLKHENQLQKASQQTITGMLQQTNQPEHLNKPPHQKPSYLNHPNYFMEAMNHPHPHWNQTMSKENHTMIKYLKTNKPRTQNQTRNQCRKPY